MFTNTDDNEAINGRAATRRTNRIVALAISGTALVVAGGVAATLVTSSALLGAITSHASAASEQSLNGSSAVDQTQSGGTSTATAAQSRGIVDIDTVLAYQGAEAAGTGMVLTSDGEVLTNNHVVEGATRITVTVVSTGRRYAASVVGTDATDDVAVLRLANASGLTTASLDTDNAAAKGDRVTAVGNAGGTGSLVASSGTVTATEQTITTQAEESVASETLNGLIETDASVVAGDSGGPLYNANGRVIGMDTAASTSSDGGVGGGTSGGYGGDLGGNGTSDGSGYGYGTSATAGSSGSAQAYGSDASSTASTGAGYAIPISDALAIVRQIDAGNASDTVQLGSPAFLGVEVGSGSLGGYSRGQQSAGAVVEQVVDGTPAASAGIEAGDTIIGLGGAAISSADDLTAALAKHKPGQRVEVDWIDASGAQQSATVTLGTGPAA